MAEQATGRIIWHITGKDALPFLQGILSNDVRPLTHDQGLIWTALLTPQGKYLADFFVVRTADQLLIDIADHLAEPTLRRLTMYRLRADVQIVPCAMPVARGLGLAPAAAFADPRHPALGWRAYGVTGGDPVVDWDAIRVDHSVPEARRELIPDDSYILEMGFERLHGVDFRKGCYVGQEVTARMKHKTDLRKGLVRVSITGAAPEGTAITAQGKVVGTLHTQAGGYALAYLRFDQAVGDMQAGGATLRQL
jgi:tRNA-modifying protein YgfZ